MGSLLRSVLVLWQVRLPEWECSLLTPACHHMTEYWSRDSDSGGTRGESKIVSGKAMGEDQVSAKGTWEMWGQTGSST